MNTPHQLIYFEQAGQGYEIYGGSRIHPACNGDDGPEPAEPEVWCDHINDGNGPVSIEEQKRLESTPEFAEAMSDAASQAMANHVDELATVADANRASLWR